MTEQQVAIDDILDERRRAVEQHLDKFERLGNRLQVGRQQAVLPSQALDHRAPIVASLHDVMVRQNG